MTNVFYLGEKVRATARLADGTEVTADIGRHDGVVSGDRIALDIDTEHLHVVKR
ncbi:MAG: TOBE domain-containing protein [Haloplanus sp.]